MAKTKFFRVATSGATTDGRTIDPQTLIDMAANYNPQTYQARVNLEHIKGVSPDSGFGAYGDVLALKTEPVTLNVGGKDEQRVGLYAQIDALDPLVALKAKGQKLFTSIEVRPNFAASGKPYLDGLAFTDNPASLGTEQMKFCAGLAAAGNAAASPLHFRKSDAGNIFTAAEEASFDIESDAPAPDDASSPVMDALKRIFGGFSAAPPVVVAPPVAAPTPAITDPAVFQAFGALRTVMEQFATSSAETARSLGTLNTHFAASQVEIAALKAQLETHQTALAKIPGASFTARPASAGGGGNIDVSLRATC